MQDAVGMPPGTPPLLALPAGASVADFADGCRAAALDFVNRVGLLGDQQELAHWLRGPYRTHAAPVAHAARPRIDAASVPPRVLHRILAGARTEVMQALARIDAMAAALVVRCQDSAGAQGWAPVAHPRMRLVDRVLSLVAADYLLRGDDYEQALFRCETCGLLAFDAQARADAGQRGACRAHARRGARELAPVLAQPLAPTIAIAG
jgi:hypothetical protein